MFGVRMTSRSASLLLQTAYTLALRLATQLRPSRTYGLYFSLGSPPHHTTCFQLRLGGTSAGCWTFTPGQYFKYQLSGHRETLKHGEFNI